MFSVLSVLYPGKQKVLFGGYLCIMALVLLFKNYFRYFDYENSGEVITIKSRNAYMKKISLTEIPKEKILDFEIDILFYSAVLKLVLRSNKRTKIAVYYRLTGLGQENLIRLHNSLRNTIT
jgi:hypothetical protein